ncbi:hypothetical protein [Sinomonas gamaensis]|uniref:hypothetical protein n=1 Tax=Sinomonas gamaensis TaxID=2565624 RepID=UPI001109DACD|nr:hypothetical protein [Sinomonas gamaensis]
MSREIVASIATWSKAEVAELIGQYSAYRKGEEITLQIYDRPTDGQYRFTINADVTNDPS